MATTPLRDTLTPEQQEALARSIPFPSRFGKPSEYADLVAHLISNRMKGEVIRIDGAIRMGIAMINGEAPAAAIRLLLLPRFFGAVEADVLTWLLAQWVQPGCPDDGGDPDRWRGPDGAAMSAQSLRESRTAMSCIQRGESDGWHDGVAADPSGAAVARRRGDRRR